MIGLLQRVSEARVSSDGRTLGAIGRGIVVLVGVERDDTQTQAARLLERLLGYRVFADADGRMNLSVQHINGGLLLVPQFTLAADTAKGMRASFTPAAPPDHGASLFVWLCAAAQARHADTVCGEFGADMQLALVNDGPVTFWLRA